MRRFLQCLVLVISTLAIPRSASAVITDFYDTVDFAEISRRNFNFSGGPPTLTVRGVLSSGTAPTTRTYIFNVSTSTDQSGLDTAMHCHKLAVLTMSKPGKFQFAISAPSQFLTDVGCRLTLVTP